jgi:hypothetical protein
VNNKDFFIFSTVDVSSIIDFSRAVIDEGVVDSPLNKEIGQISFVLSLPFEELIKGWNL